MLYYLRKGFTILLSWYKLPKPIQEEMEHSNGHITSKDTELVILNSPQRKVQGQMASQVNSIKHLEKS